MDINSLISSYVEKNGGDAAEIREKMRQIANDLENSDSIFEYGSEATSEEFLNFVTEIAKKDDDSFKEDAELLFNILDADGNGELSTSELGDFTRTQGSQAGKVTGWSMFSNIIKSIGRNESDIATSAASGAAAQSETIEDAQVPAAGTDGVDGDETDETETSNTTSEPENIDWNDPSSVKKTLDTFVDSEHKTYEDVINFLLEIGAMTDEDAEAARTALTKGSLSAADQAKVDKLVAMGMSEEDAIKSLGIENTEDTTALTETVYKEVNAEAYADQLYEAMKGAGTDESTLKSILNDDQISDEDLVKIVQAYEKKYGQDAGGKGLITRIENETSGSLQSELTSKIGQRLISAAENGDEDAIDVICKEIYSGTAGQMNTANDFLDAIFATEDEDVLYNINERYGKVNNGRDLITDIKNDHGGIFNWRNWGWNVNASGNGQSYIDKIKEAVRHH